MTIAVPVHRALSAKLASRSFNVVTRWGYNPWLARVQSTPNDEQSTGLPSLCPKSKSVYTTATRTYATTAASKPAGRPKAHTGRAPAKRSTKTSTSSKPGPKTAAGKKAVGRKPKTKSAKAKAKPKPKATPKPKKPAVKKAPSAAALARQRRVKNKELRETALLDPPKLLPATQWSVLLSEIQPKGNSESISLNAKEASQKYKNLTPEEKEHYNHIANKNKAANATAYKNWIAQYSPQRIRDANNARHLLKKQYMEKYPRRRSTAKYANIKDERLVTQPRSSFVYFTKERHASGDFAHMTIGESAKLIGREWKALNATERKKYEDEQKADIGRYVEEHKSVYGEAPARGGKGNSAA